MNEKLARAGAAGNLMLAALYRPGIHLTHGQPQRVVEVDSTGREAKNSMFADSAGSINDYLSQKHASTQVNHRAVKGFADGYMLKQAGPGAALLVRKGIDAYKNQKKTPTLGGAALVGATEGVKQHQGPGQGIPTSALLGAIRGAWGHHKKKKAPQMLGQPAPKKPAEAPGVVDNSEWI